MKSEALLLVLRDVGYLQQVTCREFRGRSMSVGFRVAKGVYVRPGTFRGRAVESTSMEQRDADLLGITTKHLYSKVSHTTWSAADFRKRCSATSTSRSDKPGNSSATGSSLLCSLTPINSQPPYVLANADTAFAMAPASIKALL